MSRHSFLLFATLGFLLATAVVVRAQQTTPPTTEFKVPPEEAAKANPVKPTAESIERGRTIYGYDCALCHGKAGDGKGDVPIEGKHDFTDPDTQKKYTDGEMAYLIRMGKGAMPAEGSRGKPEDIWNLVNYVRSLSPKGAAAPSK